MISGLSMALISNPLDVIKVKIDRNFCNCTCYELNIDDYA